MSFGDFLTCPYIDHRITSFIISNLLETITHLPNSHQSGRQSERQLLECFILISRAGSLFLPVVLSSLLLHLPQAGCLAHLVTASPWLHLTLAFPLIV